MIFLPFEPSRLCSEITPWYIITVFQEIVKAQLSRRRRSMQLRGIFQRGQVAGEIPQHNFLQFLVPAEIQTCQSLCFDAVLDVHVQQILPVVHLCQIIFPMHPQGLGRRLGHADGGLRDYGA